jgi:hypothetical protein
MYKTQLQPFPTGFMAASGSSSSLMSILLRTKVPLLLLTASTAVSTWKMDPIRAANFGESR